MGSGHEGKTRVAARRRTSAAVLGVAALATLSACFGSDGSSDDESRTQITVWSEERAPERVAATKQIISGFTKRTGIEVTLVPVARGRLQRLVTATPTPDGLPDVIGALPLASVHLLAAGNLIDTDAVADVVDDLGRDTFRARALQLTSRAGRQLAVPSDAWAQLLVYRKDLFDEANLPVPDTLDRLRSDAKALSGRGMAGIVLPTTPDVFTEHTFEYLALANGCRMVDETGEVSLDSPNCVDTFGYYADIAKRYGPRGHQDAQAVRAAYLAGKAAIVPWSSFILDELGGLDAGERPTCAKCKGDKAFLAKNSGVVTAVKGPSGIAPVQYGDIASWTIMRGADGDAAGAFVSYMMGDGYTKWLGLAPEGKIPVRTGTKDDPGMFTRAWGTLEAGTDEKAPLSTLYSSTVLDLLQRSPDNFARWGLTRGQEALAGAMLGELPAPKALDAVVDGKVDAAGAAEQAQRDVEAIQQSLR